MPARSASRGPRANARDRTEPAGSSETAWIIRARRRFSDYSQRMDGTMLAAVRRFNRLVTERAGALDDRYLARGRPLGEARLLWEIGAGQDVRALRARLGL